MTYFLLNGWPKDLANSGLVLRRDCFAKSSLRVLTRYNSDEIAASSIAIPLRKESVFDAERMRVIELLGLKVT
jgi:hypothetical protein